MNQYLGFILYLSTAKNTYKISKNIYFFNHFTPTYHTYRLINQFLKKILQKTYYTQKNIQSVN